MKNSIFYVLTLAAVLWVQIVCNYFAGTSGVTVNVILVSVLFFGLARGPMAGETLGFFWGLLMDASSLGVIGLHALLYAGAGYLAGMWRRQLDEMKVWTQTIFSFGISILYVLCYFVMDRMFSQAPHPLSWSMLAQPFINAAVAPLIFWLLQRWLQLWNLMSQED